MDVLRTNHSAVKSIEWYAQALNDALQTQYAVLRRYSEDGELLHFQFIKQYRDKTSETIDTNYFSTVIKYIKDEFADRFQQFKTNETTLAFIVNPLNPNSNEIRIESFGIDTRSQEMQVVDLKSKAL
ncbi:SCAN domain-containing protein 3 [Trichonephila clavipes]|nr:SCAN domain-containing protein 3 [Trichonephila clavipes]